MRPKKEEEEKSPLLILVEELERILKIWENVPDSWKNIIGKITQSSDPTVSDPQTPPQISYEKSEWLVLVDIDVVDVGGVDVGDVDVMLTVR